MLCITFAFVGCGGPSDAARITAFEPSEEALSSGGSATASVRVENTGTEERTFWVGLSVQDSQGNHYDAPPSSMQLEPGEESETQELSTVPLENPGYYTAEVSLWEDEPEEGKEVGRPIDQKESIFSVYNLKEDFDSPELDGSRWRATSKKLGQGRLEPANVAVEDGQLRIKLPESSLDGGEIESKDLYENGFYAARIKVPDAPSSITGFFLYQPPDYESEVDIELYNDSSRKIMFTTYADGERTHTETMELSFDPTKGFHDYAFFYDRDAITFYVDGEPVKEYEGGLPSRPMKLYLNSWFPAWLSGEQPPSDRYAYVDWIER